MATEIRFTIQAVPGTTLTEHEVQDWMDDLAKLVRRARTADEKMASARIASTQIVVLDGMSIVQERTGWF